MKQQKINEFKFNINKFNIKNTFLKLTKYTVPYNTEPILENLLPKKIKKDEFGNYYYRIGKSKTMFTAHLDDVSWDNEIVNHKTVNDFIRTDGSTILGADDKAGVTILLYMIYKRVPGTYYFFIGEEHGMVGSKGIIRLKKKWFSDNFKRCISFDRKGYGSIISSQLGQICCSNEFIDSLIKEYGKYNLLHRNDPTGVFTDSAAFIGIIPECTNISVGYFNEHSNNERQNIVYLDLLSKASSKIKWDNLPSPGITKNPQNYNNNNNNDYYDEYGEYGDFDNIFD